MTLVAALVVVPSAACEDTTPTAPRVPADATPDELADLACARVTADLTRAIAEDRPATDVLVLVDHARELADAAARADARHVRLASGVAAVGVALRSDDPAAARTGIRVVLDVCGGRG